MHFLYHVRRWFVCLEVMSHVIRKFAFAISNNKGEDQPVHPHSLIGAFVIRCLDSIIPLLAIFKIFQGSSQSV